MNICATVGIKANMTLDRLAALVSDKLCGGIEFIGIEDYVREEIPAMYTARDFLGMRVVLFGENNDFGLDIEQWRERAPDDVGAEYVDLSKYVALLLAEIDGVQVY